MGLREKPKADIPCDRTIKLPPRPPTHSWPDGWNIFKRQPLVLCTWVLDREGLIIQKCQGGTAFRQQLLGLNISGKKKNIKTFKISLVPSIRGRATSEKPALHLSAKHSPGSQVERTGQQINVCPNSDSCGRALHSLCPARLGWQLEHWLVRLLSLQWTYT